MSELFDTAREYFNRNTIENLFSVSGAYWQGDNYLTINPLSDSTKIKSFSIKETGVYYDFSSDDKGDLIDLVSLSQGIDKVEAAKYIIKTS